MTCVSLDCSGLHQSPIHPSKQAQKPASPVQPVNASPDKISPNKSPPQLPPASKGFNPNAPSFVPMGLSGVQRPVNVSGNSYCVWGRGGLALISVFFFILISSISSHFLLFKHQFGDIIVHDLSFSLSPSLPQALFLEPLQFQN